MRKEDIKKQFPELLEEQTCECCGKKFYYNYVQIKKRVKRKLKNEIIAELKKLNYGWVDWNGFDGDGGMLKTKAEAWKNMKASINEPIEVILFHDYSKITTSLLPEFIEFLQNKGYILLPLFYESNMINK